MNRQILGHRAVVIGGSIAGLTAARVLADRFERVTVLDRDELPAKPTVRKGVPQAHHFHVLLQRGQACLEALFPGFAAELFAAGAARLDGGRDLAWRTPAGWGVRFTSPIVKIGASRQLVEWTIRRRVEALPRIEIRDQVEVAGLMARGDGRGVAGVALRRRGGAKSAPVEKLRADLIVDASGRGSRAPRWLAALGYPRPEESVVDARMGYASRVYRAPSAAGRDWRAVFVQAAPPRQNRAAVIFPVEGGRWMVSVAGGAGEFPPGDEDGFSRFLAELPSPVIAEALAAAEPLSPIATNRSTVNRLRHYDRLPRWPERLVVVGDALCAFNPVYGQGMTMAVLGAIELAGALRRHRGRDLDGVAGRAQRRLAAAVADPWLLTTAEDCRYPGVRGARPTPATRWMHRYMNRVVELTTESAAVRLTFLQVQHMLRRPPAVFRPGILLRVAARMLAGAARARPGEQSGASAGLAAELSGVGKEREAVAARGGRRRACAG